MKRFKIVHDYPAYEVVTFADGIEPLVYDGEILTDERHLENWQLGSVVMSAAERGADPIAVYNRTVARGEETHWANNMGAMLSSNPQKQQRRIVVKYGDEIIFHGQKFIIKKTPNNNIALVPVVAVTKVA